MSILIVIPCLNEEAHLPQLLSWLLADPAAATARIVVADGGSTDRSAAIVEERARADSRLTLLHNSQRRQSAGMNLAFAAFGDGAEYVLRVDAHADYPRDFLFRLIAAQRQTGADAVAVSMRATAQRGACFQRAAATAQNSVLGAGGSPHRKTGARRWVDHGHHALFTAAAYRRAGGYDESFTHNEDAELDRRIAAQGGRILLAADILIDYYPRAAPIALARQYFHYGAGRARTWRKHGGSLKLRQLAPAMVAPAAALAVLAPAAWPLALPALAWATGSLGYGSILGLRARSLCALGAGPAAMIMHLFWSIGFLSALIGAARR